MEYSIYKITCLITGKIYIGITKQTVYNRWKQHISQSFDTSHKDTHFHAAIRKYGINNFDVETIDKAENEDTAKDLEQYYINKFNSYTNGYNSTPGGDTAGFVCKRAVMHLDSNLLLIDRYESVHDAAVSCNIADCSMNYRLSVCRCTLDNTYWVYEDTYDDFCNNMYSYIMNRSNRVLQLNSVTLDIINVYENNIVAARVFNGSDVAISNACKCESAWTAYGYAWCKEDDFTEEWCDKYNNTRRSRNIAVCQLDRHGKNPIEIYDSVNDAARATNTSAIHISEVCRGLRTYANNYNWIYMKDYADWLELIKNKVIPNPEYYHIYKTTTDNRSIVEIYESIEEAADKNYCTYSRINAICKGERKTHNGYTYWYEYAYYDYLEDL